MRPLFYFALSCSFSIKIISAETLVKYLPDEFQYLYILCCSDINQVGAVV
jgi:hypothetical protein